MSHKIGPDPVYIHILAARGRGYTILSANKCQQSANKGDASMHLNEFAAQVRTALRHLHDLVFLVSLPLTKELAPAYAGRDNAARALRSAILDTITQLQPNAQENWDAADERGYSILYGRYVQGMTTEELLDELAISLRQLRREEKRALEVVAQLLWERLGPLLTAPSPKPETANDSPSPLRAETQAFLAQSQSTEQDLREILTGVLEIVRPLIGQHRVEVVLQEEGFPCPVMASRVALRQALLSAMLEAVTGLSGGHLAIRLDYSQSTDYVVLQMDGGPYCAQSATAEHRLDTCRALITEQGGEMAHSLTGSLWQLRLSIPRFKQQVCVLVIDDNEKLIELFKRYTTGTRYQVIGVRSGDEALASIRSQPPDIITLDVMMPPPDGWELLQRLRAKPELATVPILVCSVVNEPALAAMLGANDFLPKPVTQDALLSALSRWTLPLSSRA